jgi:CBS domain containing-hemolysin-like protein
VSTWAALAVSVLLLALNGFFVASEFALVAARRHRLEQAATRGSRAARAALAGTRELALMLAGAQLGITLCSLGLGALAEPAIADLLEPAFAALGLPDQAGYIVAFVLALSLVAFLHMVVGETAPKSWVISRPERAALLLAVPFRAFARAARPALAVLNALANACLRVVNVVPQDELAQAHGPEELRVLIEDSRRQGLLSGDDQELLTATLALRTKTVARVMTPADQIVSVHAGAGAVEVERVSRETGRSRLAVDSGGRIAGVVHVRDAVRATTWGTPATAESMMVPALTLRADRTLVTAVQAMRTHRAQVAVVSDRGATVGLVALEDLLEEVIGEFDDETDPVVAAGRHPRGRRHRA